VAEAGEPSPVAGRQCVARDGSNLGRVGVEQHHPMGREIGEGADTNLRADLATELRQPSGERIHDRL
jgi:hypothetical protein